jgi:hypothetical protein
MSLFPAVHVGEQLLILWRWENPARWILQILLLRPLS